MSTSRYFSNFLTINQGYLSAGTSRQGDNFTFNDVVSPNRDAMRSNVIITQNVDKYIFENPISTANFNIIKVSIDTNNNLNGVNDTLFLDVLQGHTPENRRWRRPAGVFRRCRSAHEDDLAQCPQHRCHHGRQPGRLA